MSQSYHKLVAAEIIKNEKRLLKKFFLLHFLAILYSQNFDIVQRKNCWLEGKRKKLLIFHNVGVQIF